MGLKDAGAKSSNRAKPKDRSEANEFKTLLKATEALGLSKFDLIEEIEQVKAEEANEVNASFLAQVRYLYDCHGFAKASMVVLNVAKAKKAEADAIEAGKRARGEIP